MKNKEVVKINNNNSFTVKQVQKRKKVLFFNYVTLCLDLKSCNAIYSQKRVSLEPEELEDNSDGCPTSFRVAMATEQDEEK